MILYEGEDEGFVFSRLSFCNLVKDYFGVQLHNWYYKLNSSFKGCTDTDSNPSTKDKATPLYIKRKIN